MDKINIVLEQALLEIENCQSVENIKEVFSKYLSKKGEISNLMANMKNLALEQKKEYGRLVNEAKEKVETAFNAKQDYLIELETSKRLESEKIDISAPAKIFNVGHLHPLMIVWRQLEDIFREMGYSVIEGSEVELDLYNFERANIGQDHPARDMQDTFYIDVNRLLRTHTTAIQTRTLEQFAPNVPIKVVCPGKVYRKDDDDATHSHQFIQMEGLVVGYDITLSDLKGTLQLLADRMFDGQRKIRFRPSYFQFTEPSVEVDVSCHLCNQKGCSVCKHTGWIEILGAGMVHPNVLKMAGFNDDKLVGFAFGVGVERIAMLKYGVDDIRLFYQNDLRFLKQFKNFE